MSEAIVLYRGRGTSNGDDGPKTITNSGEYIAPVTGTYIVSCVGGGGGGGGGCIDAWNSMTYHGNGGICGTLNTQAISLNEGDKITLTIGDGGAGGVNNTTRTLISSSCYNSKGTDGSAGGTTTFGSYVSGAGGRGGYGSWSWQWWYNRVNTWNNQITSWNNGYKWVNNRELISTYYDVFTGIWPNNNGYTFAYVNISGNCLWNYSSSIASTGFFSSKTGICLFPTFSITVEGVNITSKVIDSLGRSNSKGYGNIGTSSSYYNFGPDGRNANYYSFGKTVYYAGLAAGTNVSSYRNNTVSIKSDAAYGGVSFADLPLYNLWINYNKWNNVNAPYNTPIWTNTPASWNNTRYNSRSNCMTSIIDNSWWYTNNNTVSTSGTRTYRGDGGASGQAGNAGFILIIPPTV